MSAVKFRALPQPWPIGSKDRTYRLSKLCEAFMSTDYDIIALQEIWSEHDFSRINEAVKDTYPYSYYFHRGDWFGGKVVGMVELEIGTHRINFYTTHLHAEYNRENDLYLPHRLSQAFELSQFVKHTSHAADAVILTGDLNLEPDDLGYRVIVENANLIDAWLVRPNKDGCETGMTCDRPDNCYTSPKLKQPNPDGKRLDYIMYKCGKSDVGLVQCENRFDRIPGDKQINYSDHLGVYAEFIISEQHEKVPIYHCGGGAENSNEYTNHDQHDHHKEKQERWITSASLLKESIRITGEGETRAFWDRRLFLGVSFVLTAILVSTLNVEIYYPSWTALATVFRFLLTLVIGFCLWYGLIGLTMELKALKAAKASMAMLLND
ncbi:Putative neutral sphingomyelinase [Toxocara canis]|uniref:sphingomyelin phosphodiesterase n=1 Tax=Toxocara canis TaxID=6265 RepID=A0A0B2VW85_TOXCA|nr:Putative neutral sphingomyelinase [Toxocara canis]